MSDDLRRRLAQLLADPGADLAEAALLCAGHVNPELDPDIAILRIEAYTDDLRTRGFPRSDPAAQAASLAGYLNGRQGFTGDRDSYHDPANSLLDRVIERKRGMPITLSILYIAVARRLRARAFGIGLPGHFVTGIAVDDGRPVVIDPYHDGVACNDEQLAALVERVTGGRARYDASMLRPEPAGAIIRRLLANLTRDCLAAGDVDGALRAMEVGHVLPHAPLTELRAYGELLARTGRYRAAADAFDAYLDADPAAADADEVRAIALRARAKLN